MPAAYSLCCPTCGSAFLATHTRVDTITSCPHCAHLAPLRDFVVAGAAALGSAPALPMQRRRGRRAVPSDGGQMETQIPTVSEGDSSPPSPPPGSGVSQRRGAAQPAFVPLDEDGITYPSPPPGRKSLPSLAKGLLALLAVMTLAGIGWFINLTPESDATPVLEIRQPALPSPAVLTSATSTKADGMAKVAESSAAPAKAAPIPPIPGLDDEIEAARLNSEAPEVMRALFDGPAEERFRHVLGGDRFAARMSAFFSRPEPVQAGGLRRLSVNPIDLLSGRPVVLFQAATSANPRGALARFHRAGEGGLLLDWELFEETHDAELERFAQSGTGEPRWFHAGIRRNHGLDFQEAFRQMHHCFDLQAGPGALLDRLGVVARDLPVGRHLNQSTDWRATYLARLLLKNRILPDGTAIFEIVDCEGAGLGRLSESVPAPALPK